MVLQNKFSWGGDEVKYLLLLFLLKHTHIYIYTHTNGIG